LGQAVSSPKAKILFAGSAWIASRRKFIVARGAELCIRHRLPFKIHTGLNQGANGLSIDTVHAAHLNPLIVKYSECNFVLMHISYGAQDELIALAKGRPNVYLCLCWAWTINPLATMNFLREAIHALPSNKIFAFGADTAWPNGSWGYAYQARAWLTRALEAEVQGGDLTEREAIKLASRFMRENQHEFFNIETKRNAVRVAMARA
jgi:uncharacterized protein